MKDNALRAAARRFVGTGLALALCLSCAGTAAAQTPEAWSTSQTDEPARQLIDLNPAMLSVGSGLFLGAFVPSLIYAKSEAYNSETALKYPLVGPWIDLGTRRCSVDPCTVGNVNGGLLVLDGISQGLGVALITAGLFAGPRLLGRWFGDGAIVVSPVRLAPYAYGVGAGGGF